MITNGKSMPTRREAISGLSAATALFMCPMPAHASAPTPLHEDVAQRVRELAPTGGVTLKLVNPHGSAGNVKPVIAAFKAMTGVSITLQETPVDEINTVLMLDALSQTKQFDLALPATFGLPDLITSGALLPITDFAKRHEPPGYREDILYGVGDLFDSEIYGFQTDGDAYIMFYHKDMAENPDEIARYEDRFGQTLGVPQTWTELDRQMAFFHRPDAGQWGGLLFRSPGYLAWEWWVRFHAKGIWPFSADMQPQIASDAGVAALEEMIRATQSLHKATADLTLFGNWERFEKGDIYCNIGWGGSQKFLNNPKSNMRGRMLYGPTPGGIVNDQLLTTPYFNWGWNYVVSSSSSHPEIAYLFALFASTPEMSTLSVRQDDGFFDPFRAEHYEDAGIISTYTPEFLKVHRDSLEMAIPDLYLKNQGEYFRALTQWLVRAMSGDVKPRKALENVAQQWDLITRSSGSTLQIERWNQLRAKYPARTRDLLADLSEPG